LGWYFERILLAYPRGLQQVRLKVLCKLRDAIRNTTIEKVRELFTQSKPNFVDAVVRSFALHDGADGYKGINQLFFVTHGGKKMKKGFSATVTLVAMPAIAI
jgi:hypothetical protein